MVWLGVGGGKAEAPGQGTHVDKRQTAKGIAIAVQGKYVEK